MTRNMASSLFDILFLLFVAFGAYYVGNYHFQTPGEVAPGTRIDAATGIEFSEKESFQVGKKFSLLGVGTRKKTVLNVYSLGLFASPAITKEIAKSEGKSDTCQVLMKSTSPKAVELTMNMGIGPEKIAEAVSGLAGVDQKVRTKFHDMLIDGLGEGKLKKGESMTFEWKGADTIMVTARGKPIGSMKDKKLAPGVFNLYVGPKSVSPSLKKDLGCA